MNGLTERARQQQPARPAATGNCWRLTLQVAALIFMVLTAGTVQAAIDGVSGIFEMDGDAIDATPAPGDIDDWTSLIPTASGDSDALVSRFQDGGRGGMLFTKGSKDIDSIANNWRYREGSVPPGNDFINSYAGAYTNPDNDLLLVCGVDRYQTNGNFAIGCWFFQDDVGPNTGPGEDDFHGEHKDGDVLITAEFGGQGLDAVNVFFWQGDDTTGTLVNVSGTLKDGNSKVCSTINMNQEPACGEVNGSPIDIPWEPGSTYKSANGEQVPPGTFVEVIINLTELLNGAEAGCFTTFMATSRSSATEQAELKEFAVDGFPLCGISVTKQCGSGTLNADDTITFAVNGTVTNTGFGTLHNVMVSDSPIQFDGGALDLGTISAAAGPVPYNGTITVPLANNNTKDFVTATGTTSSTGGTTVTSELADATCSLLINPMLSLTKECDSVTVVSDGASVQPKVKVKGMVCNTKSDQGRIKDVVVIDTVEGLDTVVFGPQDLAPDTCEAYSHEYTPTEANDITGNPTSNPGDVVFQDTAKAAGSSVFGDPVLADPQTAYCPLCPVCPDC